MTVSTSFNSSPVLVYLPNPDGLKDYCKSICSLSEWTLTSVSDFSPQHQLTIEQSWAYCKSDCAWARAGYDSWCILKKPHWNQQWYSTTCTLQLRGEHCDKPRASHIKIMMKYFAVQPLLSWNLSCAANIKSLSLYFSIDENSSKISTSPGKTVEDIWFWKTALNIHDAGRCHKELWGGQTNTHWSNDEENESPPPQAKSLEFKTSRKESRYAAVSFHVEWKQTRSNRRGKLSLEQKMQLP